MERAQSSERWYDGPVYATLIDRQLSGLHDYIAAHLPPGDFVLDACCGTGALSMRLAQTGRTVLGVDLSARHIDYAQRRTATAGAVGGSASFEHLDVTQVPPPPGGTFDVAVIVLALHEMPREARRPVLDHLMSVSSRVMVVDFAAPMPQNFAGMRNRLTEVAAGRQHFSSFQDWLTQGGIDGLIADTPVSVELDRTIDAGTMRVTVLVGGDTG